MSGAAVRVTSENFYQNVSEVSAVVDLSGLTSTYGMNIALYFIATNSDQYCDSGGNGNCGEIDLMETNGNGIMQTTVHSDHGNGASNPQDYQYVWTGNTQNSAFKQPNSFKSGEWDVSSLSSEIMSSQVKLVAQFSQDSATGKYNGLKVTLSKTDGSNPQPIFDSSLTNDGSEGKCSDKNIGGGQNIDWDAVTKDMQKGQVLVVSMHEYYAPQPTCPSVWVDYSAKWTALCTQPQGPILKDMTITAASAHPRT